MKMEPLLSVKDVAKLLNWDDHTVYDHAADLGGFYPAGVRKLSFKPGVIREHMEGQGFKDMAVQFSPFKKGVHGKRLQNTPGRRDCPIQKTKGNIGIIKTDPSRHGL